MKRQGPGSHCKCRKAYNCSGSLGQLSKVTCSRELTNEAHHLYELFKCYRANDHFVHLHNQVAGGGGGGDCFIRRTVKMGLFVYTCVCTPSLCSHTGFLNKNSTSHNITQHYSTNTCNYINSPRSFLLLNSLMAFATSVMTEIDCIRLYLSR